MPSKWMPRSGRPQRASRLPCWWRSWVPMLPWIASMRLSAACSSFALARASSDWKPDCGDCAWPPSSACQGGGWRSCSCLASSSARVLASACSGVIAALRTRGEERRLPVALRAGADALRAVVFAAVLRTVFFAAALRAIFFAGVALRTTFFAVPLRVAFRAATFFAAVRFDAVFFAADLRAGAFRAADLLAAFFAALRGAALRTAFFAADLRTAFLAARFVAFFAAFFPAFLAVVRVAFFAALPPVALRTLVAMPCLRWTPAAVDTTASIQSG